MARQKPAEDSRRPRRPATSPEARENELVSLAHDLAEKQIRQGDASSQVITHFLKLGSSRERLEQQRIEHENAMMQAKMEAMESQARMEETYVNALKAMQSYTGLEPPQLDDEEV